MGAVRHTFQSVIADDPVAEAAGEVTPGRWNANHDVSTLAIGDVPSISTAVSTSVSTATSSIVSLSTSASTGLSTATSGIVSLSTSASTAVNSLSTATSTGLSTGVSSVTSLSTSSSTAVNSLSTATSTALGQIPQNSRSAAYTTVAGDAGKHIYHPTSDNNPRTFTIDSNANVAYAIGTAITFVNEINTVTIAITSDTLVLAGTGSTGSRTLAANGIATAIKVTSTRWVISGTGLT